MAYDRQVKIFWGKTNTGKSRLAWEEASEGGLVQVYAKDPRSKFWYGYRGERNVIIDEFRGGIDVSHLLRWTDRYPCSVEIKGSSRPLLAEKLWITSNIHPKEWYQNLDPDTVKAVLRRLTIIHFENPFTFD